MSVSPSIDQAEDLFSAPEFRILQHYFEHGEDHSPLSDATRRDIASLKLGGISSVNAAVAAIVLRGIQHRLPRWVGRNQDGRIVYGRKFYLPAGERKLLLKPRWVHGDSGFGAGPGMSWSIAYHVVWVPVFDRFIVTESSDDGDEDGPADHAIGHFQSEVPHDAEQIDRILAPYRANLREMKGEDDC